MSKKIKNKFIDAEKFNAFIKTLPSDEKTTFIDGIEKKCKVRRTTYSNWRGGLCSIPDNCKVEIEKLAGQKIWSE